MLNDYIDSSFKADKKGKKYVKLESKSSKLKGNNKGKPKDKELLKKTPTHTYSETEEQAQDLSSVQKLTEKVKEFIGHLDHVPEFLKDNEFLHTGYRINFNTPMKAIKSLFMIHNESVNVWTHLGGAIVFFIICIFLCFSVTSVVSPSLNHYLHKEMKGLFAPIYERIPNLTAIDLDFKNKISQTTGDLAKYGEEALVSFEKTLETISDEVQEVTDNISPESIGKLLYSLKGKLEAVSFDIIKKSINSASQRDQVWKLTEDLRNQLNDLQKEILVKIDSADMDWIDVYTYLNPNYDPSITKGDNMKHVSLSRWPIIVFLFTAIFCLACSAVFHLFHCLSDEVNVVLKRMDYAGISILITGSTFPALVYGFYCQPIYSKIYLSLIGGTSLVVFFVSLGNKIHKPEYATIKGLMYGGLGLFAALPIIHLVYNNLTATEGALEFISALPYYLAMGASYLGGLAIYSTKCPERLMPGKFDIWGHSHQIWHVCVLLGVIFTYFGSFNNYYTRMKTPCVGCGVLN